MLLLLGTAGCAGSSSHPQPPSPAVTSRSDAATPGATVVEPLSPPLAFPETAGGYVTPIAPGATSARTDCPTDWDTIVDTTGVLSVCAPRGLMSFASVTNRGEPTINVSDSLDGMTAANSLPVFVGVQLSWSGMFAEPFEKTCAGLEPDAVVVDTKIAGYAARVCDTTIEQHDPAGPLRSLMTSINIPAGPKGLRILNMTINWRARSAGAEALARAIANSAELRLDVPGQTD